MCLSCEIGAQLGAFSEAILAGSSRTSRRRVLKAGALIAASALLPPLLQSHARADVKADSGRPMPADGPADWLFENGTILTMETDQPRVEAVAVRGRAIVYAGDRSGAQAWIGAGTRRIDLQGRMLMPGLVDSHVHPMLGTLFSSGFVIDANAKEEQVIDAIKAHVKADPGTGVFFGVGWNTNLWQAQGGPHKRDLDAIEAERPMLFLSSDGHSAWANSKALAVAGVTAATKDPPVGGYQRDANGELTGLVREAPAMVPMIAALKLLAPEHYNPALKAMLQTFAQMGFTSLFDAGMPLGLETIFAALVQMDEAGALPVRLHATRMVTNNDQVQGAVADLAELNRRFRSEHFTVRTLKIVADGVIENRQAAMLEPYQQPPGARGQLALSEANVQGLLRQCERAGFDVHFHTIGDASLRQALDALTAVQASGGQPKLTLAHVQVVADSDQQRLARLKPLITSTGIWCVRYAAVEDALGAERYRKMFRFGRLQRDHGVNVALGSDWPATYGSGTLGIRPFLNIQAAILRQPPPPLLEAMGSSLGADAEQPLPPQADAFTLEGALQAYTLAGARQMGLEAITGSIRVGKRADLVLLDRDLTAIPTEDIHRTNVLLTLMDGRSTGVDRS